MDMNKLALIPIWLIPFVFSLCFHEYAHAWAATKLGDSTPKFMGRLTMNPIAHVDPIGTLAFPIIGFLTGFPLLGWAKPVIINPRNFKGKLDDAMVSAAGPLSNVFLALCFTGLAHVLNRGNSDIMRMSGFDQPMLMMAVFGIQLNVFLAFFNLLPFPPLDGSHIFKGLFPSMAPAIDRISRYGFMILLVLLWTGVFRILLEPASRIINVLMSFV